MQGSECEISPWMHYDLPALGGAQSLVVPPVRSSSRNGRDHPFQK